jgi:hypothetical protein
MLSISAGSHCTLFLDQFGAYELRLRADFARGGVRAGHTFILRFRQDSQATLTAFLTGRLLAGCFAVSGLGAVDSDDDSVDSDDEEAGGGVRADVCVCAGVMLSSAKDGSWSAESARSEARRRCFLLGGESLSCIVTDRNGRAQEWC